jgi:hypothetical protein
MVKHGKVWYFWVLDILPPAILSALLFNNSVVFNSILIHIGLYMSCIYAWNIKFTWKVLAWPFLIPNIVFTTCMNYINYEWVIVAFAEVKYHWISTPCTHIHFSRSRKITCWAQTSAKPTNPVSKTLFPTILIRQEVSYCAKQTGWRVLTNTLISTKLVRTSGKVLQ